MKPMHPVAIVSVLRDDDGYYARLVMDGVTHITGPWASLRSLLEHIEAQVLEHEETTRCEDPRAWVV
jgi:hypothetical protein